MMKDEACINTSCQHYVLYIFISLQYIKVQTLRIKAHTVALLFLSLILLEKNQETASRLQIALISSESSESSVRGN